MGSIGKAIGNIGSSITKSIGSIAQTALKTVAPAATNLLKNIVGSGFDGVMKFAQNAVGNLPMIGGLASKLLGQGADALKGMAMGGLEKLVQGLVSKLDPRQIPGLGTAMTLPTIMDRGGATALQSAMSQIMTSAQAATGATATVAQAATAAASTAAGGGASADIKAMAGNKKTGADIASENGLDYSNKDVKQSCDLQAMQQNMQRMNEMMAALTNMMQIRHDTAKAIIQNFRG